MASGLESAGTSCLIEHSTHEPKPWNKLQRSVMPKRKLTIMQKKYFAPWLTIKKEEPGNL